MDQSLIIALDFQSKEEAICFLNQFEDGSLFVKVGMELYYSAGPEIIQEIKKRGHKIFLDLKLHDIPNTVKRAMKILAKLDVDLVNVHAAGGKRMMTAAIEGLIEGTVDGKERPKIIAVTQLTSTTEECMHAEQRIPLSLEESVLSYAKLAKEAGLDGVVCSTHEVEQIHHFLGNNFLTVTPGIRMATDDANDQKRIATPETARLIGANAIVVGRSITQAISPFEALKKVKSAWEGTK